MKMIQRLGMGILPLWLLTTACNFLGEDEFAGSKELNSEILNGPHQMKIQRVNGTDYLVVLNSNYRYQASAGSLQFYSLAAPGAPAKAPEVVASLELPSNVGDFEIVDGPPPVLYVTNRNNNQLWVYDLEGAGFKRRLDSKGNELYVKTPSNSLSLMSYTRAAGGKVLAITAQRGGTVALLDLATLTYVDPRNLGLSSYDAVQVVGSSIYGAKYYMTPRQTQTSGENDNLGVTGSRRLGVGVTKSIYYGTNDDIVVSMNAIQNGLHAFRFASFQNTSNLAWELDDWEDDTEIAPGVDREGSDETGFRGMDMDDSKVIYLASRTDNSIYKIPTSEIEQPKVDGDRNTKGFNENDRTYRLDIAFDTDETDDVFPRLGSLVVERDGSKLWVVGLGTNSVYRVDLGSNTITHTTAVGELPQRIVGYPTAGPYTHLYVANTQSDTLSVLDATSMTVLTTLSNP